MIDTLKTARNLETAGFDRAVAEAIAREKAPSPDDRIAAFMDQETIVDDVRLRVVELTGEPGDMVFCHPAMVHCGAPNRGERPRFMRIKQQLLTHAGRARLGALS